MKDDSNLYENNMKPFGTLAEVTRLMGIGVEWPPWFYKGASMSRKVITPEVGALISELRHEVDGWGDPKWSYKEIADKLGLSETTVWRAANRSGSYKVKNRVLEEKQIEKRWDALEEDRLRVLEKPTAPSVARAAAESLERLLALQEKEKFLAPSPELEKKLERYGVRRKAPLSPMEGGEYPGDGGGDDQPPSGLSRLVREADEAKKLAEGGV